MHTERHKRGAVAYGLFAVTPEQVFDAVVDFEHYSDFMPMTSVSRVERRDGDDVTFYTELLITVKRICYTLKLTCKRETTTVDWTMVSGDLKVNDGGWTLVPYGDGHTLARYNVHIETGFFVPSFMISKLTEGSLPEVIRAVRKRVGDTHYR